MGRKSKQKTKNKKRSGGSRTQQLSSSGSEPYNFVPGAGPGCFIAQDVSAPFLIGHDPFDPSEYDPDVEIPEIALDPCEITVSVTNDSPAPGRRVCYVTVYDVPVVGKGGRVLASGVTIDNEGNSRSCVTFIVLCPPMTFVHLCRLELPPGKDLADVEIDSDVREWEPHPCPDDTHTESIGFPLKCDDGCSFLCTQGEGGHLTHFLLGNLHAVDFRCDIGTPIVSVCDGVVVDFEHDNSLTGVAVSNLFKWNSIIIQADVDCSDESQDADSDSAAKHDCAVEKADYTAPSESIRGGPLYVEYVHIQAHSVTVRPGDRVKRGQVICKSGSVGFSPEPHLHFSAFRSRDPTAPTVRVKFRSDSTGELFLPSAGLCYDRNGLVTKVS